MNALSIGTSAIRQFDGLYSLNDLHKAAGNESKHQPALFVRLDQTQALIEEIVNSTDMQSLAIKSKGGRNGGTFACKELVYAYAMWISPAFMLKVIRAYDALMQQPNLQPRLSGTQASSKRRLHIRSLVGERVSKTGKSFSDVWHEIHAVCQITKLDDLTDSGYLRAIEFLGALPIYDTPPEIQAKALPVLPKSTTTDESSFQPIPITTLMPRGRYMVSLGDDGALSLRPLNNNEMVLSWSRLPERIQGSLNFELGDETLLKIKLACEKVLEYRIEVAERRLIDMKRRIKLN